jgi:hypothetical protein
MTSGDRSQKYSVTRHSFEIGLENSFPPGNYPQHCRKHLRQTEDMKKVYFRDVLRRRGKITRSSKNMAANALNTPSGAKNKRWGLQHTAYMADKKHLEGRAAEQDNMHY